MGEGSMSYLILMHQGLIWNTLLSLKFCWPDPIHITTLDASESGKCGLPLCKLIAISLLVTILVKTLLCVLIILRRYQIPLLVRHPKNLMHSLSLTQPDIDMVPYVLITHDLKRQAELSVSPPHHTQYRMLEQERVNTIRNPIWKVIL